MTRKKVCVLVTMALMLFGNCLPAYAVSGTDSYAVRFSYTFTNTGKTVASTGVHKVAYDYDTKNVTYTSSSITVSSRTNCNTSTTNGVVNVSDATSFSKPDYIVMKTYDDKQWASGMAKTTVKNSSGTITVSHTSSTVQAKNEA